MDTAAALAAALKSSIDSAVTRTARGTVVSVAADGFVTFSVGGSATPRKGIHVGPGVPQVGEIITYVDEGRGIPLVLGSTGPKDLYLSALKALIVGNTTVNNAGVTTTGTFVDSSGSLRAGITALAPSAWTAVTFQNSWVNFAGGIDVATKYRKVGDIVYLQGAVSGGSVPSTIFTLPSGFRPVARHIFPVISNASAIGRVDVNASGAVSCEVGNTANVFLSGIQFSITA